ncbi:hypothetical protein B7494_g7466 [Chlorociboria aeruginascens]|nr:hypothetical protein B7494_g7466 [Chlorociboria aeruginascens]
MVEPEPVPKTVQPSQQHVEEAGIELAPATTENDIPHLSEKVVDGDEALKILQAHFEPFTPEEERRVKWKIDIRMVLIMFLINGIQFVDKNTIAAAATYGLAKEAHLHGQQYSLLVTLFYLGYFVAQYPTNFLMQRFPLGKYLTVNIILWGLTLAASGSATKFATLATARFFMGIFESCVNPGFILITSSWWRREEQAARFGFWYSANGLMGAPFGLVFWGIAHIHARGFFPYQWMFIIVGVITVLIGISLWWLLPDSPLTASFLNDRERLIAVERLRSNHTGIKNVHHKKEQVKEALTDVKMWMLVLAVFWHNMTNSLQTSFSGLIILGFGYNTYQAVLLNIPTGMILAAGMLIVSFFLSSKWGEGKRIFIILLFYIPGIVSTAILYAIPVNPHTRGVHLYAIFTVNITAVSAELTYSLLAANIAGYTKKTVAGALYFSAYCLGNIISPQAFLTTQAPTYKTGIAVTLASYSILEIIFAGLYLMYRRENSKRDKEMADVHLTADEDLINAFSDLTDKKNKLVRYKV